MANRVYRASWVEVEHWEGNVGWADGACSFSRGLTYKHGTFS